MKLATTEHKLLKDSIDIVSGLITEAKLNFYNDRIELISMDPANVGMVILKLLSSGFVEYNVPKEESIGLNLNNLKSVLKRCGSDDVLKMSTTSSKVEVIISGKSNRIFTLPIIDLEDKATKVPNLTFNTSVVMPSKLFSSVVDDVSITAESLMMSKKGTKFCVSAAGDLSSAEVLIEANDDVKLDMKEEFKAKYSIEYLKKMMGGSKLSDSVRIQLNSDYPLIISYVVLDKASLEFVLAPRVDND